MAIELAAGYVSVAPNASGFGQKLKSQISGDIDSVSGDAGDSAGRTFTERFRSSTVGKIGAAIAGAFAAAKIGQGLAGAVDSASDLNESMTKVAAIFGDATPTVVNFASSADRSLGQSKQQALDAAATFATFGKSAGLTGDQLAGFSTSLVGVATDFASFFNTSPEDAITAIGSALVGESEPIRQYGVLLDEATVQQRALKLGLISTTKEALTPQQKVLARQAEIMAQLGDSQGDFARTAEGAANKQRILSAEAKNASAEFGQALLPAYSAFLTLMAERILPTLTKLTIFLTEHKGVAIAVGIAIGTILVGALVAWAVAAVAAAAATLAAAAPFLLIAAAVAGFIAVMIILPSIVGRNLGAVLGFFGDVFGKIVEFFKNLPGQIVGFLAGAVTWLVQTGIEVLTGLYNGILVAWPLVAAFFSALPGQILSFIGNLLGWLFNTGRDVLQGLINGYLSLVEQVAAFFATLPGRILGWIGNLIGLLFGTGQNVIQGLLNGLNSLIGSVASFFAGLPGRILGWLGNLGGLLFGAGASVIQGFINGIQSWLGSIAGNISSIPSIVRNSLGDLGGILYGAGQAIIQGLLNGIRSMAGAAADAARSVVSSAINAAKSVLGIGSPSKVFAEIGVNVGEGFVVGLGRSQTMVAAAVGDTFGGLGPAAFPSPSGLTVSTGTPAGVGSTGGGVGEINIYAQTNADPQQISRELSWTLLTRGR